MTITLKGNHLVNQWELQHEVIERENGFDITNPNGDIVLSSSDSSAFALHRAYRMAEYLDAHSGDIPGAMNIS